MNVAWTAEKDCLQFLSVATWICVLFSWPFLKNLTMSLLGIPIKSFPTLLMHCKKKLSAFAVTKRISRIGIFSSRYILRPPRPYQFRFWRTIRFNGLTCFPWAPTFVGFILKGQNIFSLVPISFATLICRELSGKKSGTNPVRMTFYFLTTFKVQCFESTTF